MKKLLVWTSKNIALLVVASLTLGLAPFIPEPHVWEKLKWISAGAAGMVWYDWFDLLMHGSPWVLLGMGLVYKLMHRREQANQKE